MAGSANPTTMNEALQHVLTDVASAMTTPDADIPFLSQLQGVVVGRMRAGAGGMGQQPGGGLRPGQSPMGAGGPPPGSTPGAGGPPAGPGASPTGPTPPPGNQLQGSPTPNGVTPLAQLPNADELRRQIAGQAGA